MDSKITKVGITVIAGAARLAAGMPVSVVGLVRWAGQAAQG